MQDWPHCKTNFFREKWQSIRFDEHLKFFSWPHEKCDAFVFYKLKHFFVHLNFQTGMKTTLFHCILKFTFSKAFCLIFYFYETVCKKPSLCIPLPTNVTAGSIVFEIVWHGHSGFDCLMERLVSNHIGAPLHDRLHKLVYS